MTVEGEHIYQVSALGIFARNEGCSVALTRITKSEEAFYAKLATNGNVNQAAAMNAAAKGSFLEFWDAIGGAGRVTNKEALNAYGKAVEFAAARSGIEMHHLMTNKNYESTAAGGPYTQKFEALAEQRGRTLEHPDNIVDLPGHTGPHPEYNRVVYERMEAATRDKVGQAFNEAYDAALAQIKKETLDPNSELNRLATGR
jgi:hypothetical protein